MTDFHIVTCPHCNGSIQIYSSEINCKIFRHAVHKINCTPVNPHASKAECDKLITDDKIYGCCKPFCIVLSNYQYIAQLCDYV